MEVYGKLLTTATSVVVMLPSVRLVLLHRFQGGICNARTVETTGPAFPLTSIKCLSTRSLARRPFRGKNGRVWSTAHTDLVLLS